MDFWNIVIFGPIVYTQPPHCNTTKDWFRLNPKITCRNFMSIFVRNIHYDIAPIEISEKPAQLLSLINHCYSPESLTTQDA